MTLKKLLLFCVFIMCQFICAQQTVILNEVIVSDSQLKNFSDTKSVKILNDSIIERNQSSLTSLLNYNSVIYFKENGLGMVSSPSFRGTTAQQTAVIWNGININSQFNGQTDFNTISSRDFSSITIRPGGGSAIYGSSAIGGSIHLNNDLLFANRFDNEFQINYGSFNTLSINYHTAASTEKTSLQVGMSRNSSDNDYEYLGMDNQKNQNGQFYNTSVNASFGYRINNANFLKLYSQVFESDRHFSSPIGSTSNSKYRDLNSRNLLEWNNFYNSFTSKVKLALITEQYTYFENADYDYLGTAKADTFIIKYDLNYKISNSSDINAIVDYSAIKAEGSDIGLNKREIVSGVLLFKKRFKSAVVFDLSIRKEAASSYKSPLLYAGGIKYAPSKYYTLKLNASRNFRIPTFNDNYWKGSGKLNLKPETANQIELENEIKLKNITFSATAYYSKITDLLRWVPRSGLWGPENVGHVTNYGCELLLSGRQNVGQHYFNLSASYAYTVSKDDDTGYQLVYVPFNKINTNLAYSYKRLTAAYQYLFNGYVFTSSDNYYFLKKYNLSNIAIDYAMGKKHNLKVGAQVLNLFNEKYQSTDQRPMPGRNYTINLTFKT